MKTFTKQEIGDRFQPLPSVVQDYILSQDVVDTLQKISGAHTLHLDKADMLGKQVTYAMLGLVSVKDIEDALRNDIGMTTEDANLVLGDIERDILGPYRTLLRKATLPPSPKENAHNDAAPSEETTPAPHPEYASGDPYREPVE